MINQVFDLQAQLLKVLANPKRLEIIHLLRNRSMSVSEIVQMVGAPQANVSQHLAVLREAGVVRDTKIGKKVFYSLAHHNLVLTQDLLREIFVERLAKTNTESTSIQDTVEKRFSETVSRAVRRQLDNGNQVEFVIDPVCKMKLSFQEVAFIHDHDGETHYFCASGCLEKFKENPKKYIN